MLKVMVFLNGCEFIIGCEEGQEVYFKLLVSYFDGKVQGIIEQVGQIGDLWLFLMVFFVVMDELKEVECCIEMFEVYIDQLRLCFVGENVYNE